MTRVTLNMVSSFFLRVSTVPISSPPQQRQRRRERSGEGRKVVVKKSKTDSDSKEIAEIRSERVVNVQVIVFLVFNVTDEKQITFDEATTARRNQGHAPL